MCSFLAEIFRMNPAHRKEFAAFGIICLTGLPVVAISCAAPDAATQAKRAEQRAADEARDAAELERKSWNGTITSATGLVLPLRIEKKFGRANKTTGSLAATNRLTGEFLHGSWTAMMQKHVGMVHANGQWGTTYGGPPTGVGTAVLRGDKGTTLHFQINVIGGWSPHGVGSGTDGEGNTWQLEF